MSINFFLGFFTIKKFPGGIGGTRILSSLIEHEGSANISHQMKDFILRNDSYNFYKKLLKNYAGDRYQLISGHTGTNVMDIQILICW
jgi:glycerate-2-kinase